MIDFLFTKDPVFLAVRDLAQNLIVPSVASPFIPS